MEIMAPYLIPSYILFHGGISRCMVSPLILLILWIQWKVREGKAGQVFTALTWHCYFYFLDLPHPSRLPLGLCFCNVDAGRLTAIDGIYSVEVQDILIQSKNPSNRPVYNDEGKCFSLWATQCHLQLVASIPHVLNCSLFLKKSGLSVSLSQVHLATVLGYYPPIQNYSNILTHNRMQILKKNIASVSTT